MTPGRPWEARGQGLAGVASGLQPWGHGHGEGETAGSEVPLVLVLTLLWLQAEMSLGEVSTPGLAARMLGGQEQGQRALCPGRGCQWAERGFTPAAFAWTPKGEARCRALCSCGCVCAVLFRSQQR